MTQLSIGPYSVYSYDEGWIVQKGTGHKRYPSSLQDAVRLVGEQWLRDSDATTFAELRDSWNAFEAQLVGLFELRLRE